MLSPGLLTTVQTAAGRPGWQSYGVAVGGALDWYAAEVANALVGNPAAAAVLEITVEGPRLRFATLTACGLAGADLGATLDGVPLRPGCSYLARPGAHLMFADRRRGARAYLAVAGGLDVPGVLGSAAADLRAGLPGLAGRPVRAGDLLAYPSVPDPITRSGRSLAASSAAPNSEPANVVRVLPGPHVDHFAVGTFEALCAVTWQVAPQADRMGYRLSGGAALGHQAQRGADVTSLGLPVGAVQVPGDGRPIILLADHQPTGGYAVLACVARADLPLVAQLLPGEALRFAPVSLADARAALAARRAAARRVLEPEATMWAAIAATGATDRLPSAARGA